MNDFYKSSPILEHFQRAEARRRRIENIIGGTALILFTTFGLTLAWALVHIVEWLGAHQTLGAW